MIEAPELKAPVDMAPAVPEIANPGFASNTTLAGTSDIYVANRGNGTVVRLTQEGKVVAVRQVAIGSEVLGPNRLNGIAVSRDAQRLWLTVSGGVPGYADTAGAVIEMPAFGPGRTGSLAPPVDRGELARRGEAFFAASFSIAEGLGPLYNAVSCEACHGFPALGGMGPEGLGQAMRVGQLALDGSYDPLEGRGGPIARRHSITELGVACGLTAGVPTAANVVSLRNAPPLFGAGLIDAIPDEAILSGVPKPGGAAAVGRAHIVTDAAGHKRVGRFGWKGDTATLEQFIADAMRNELGLTNPLARADLIVIPPGCSVREAPDDDGTVLRSLHAFVAGLPAPQAKAAQIASASALFAGAGCASCHVPQLPGANGPVPLYSDLLLHDMGPVLDDGVVQGEARGQDWRTSPLWGLGNRVRYLHDGRATTLGAAIIAHGGEAAPAAKSFLDLSAAERNQLLGFLKAL